MCKARRMVKKTSMRSSELNYVYGQINIIEWLIARAARVPITGAVTSHFPSFDNVIIYLFLFK